ncbi:hypothetical protein GCQ56_07910 [Marinifilum sp. N1E240]|uniref:hypothetical protein n=1 Tax=Marinifilum sp. N1E240 TaxID=2608082 RepID=UPI00128E567A|nr:hypothetical protein [Marinifilum sp. N1E240]MPQ46939.1 hypothetical protein [Marinifilum sp. N1E240]
MNLYFDPIKLLGLGIASIICGVYFFASTLFTFESSLIECNGKLERVEVLYKKIESSGGSGSIKSELEFRLKNEKQVFVLTKNIGQDGYNFQFEKIANKIKKSRGLTIWIKGNQINKLRPTVFRISNHLDEILYDVKDAKSKSKFGFIVSMIVGIIGIGGFVRSRLLNRYL